jgi:nucleoside-diphosphate-sugar epimerase
MFDIMRKLELQRNKLEVLGTGDQVRDFIYVSDAVEACLMLATDSTAFGNVFNVGTGVGTSIRELVALILETLGLQNKTQVFYTSESWGGDVQRLLGDVTKIKEHGFRCSVDLRAGLRYFIDWYNASCMRKAVSA